MASEDRRPYSLVRVAKEAFNLSDAELGELLGYSRTNISAIVRGVHPEYLSVAQLHALFGYCRLMRDRAIEAVEEMQLMGGPPEP